MVYVSTSEFWRRHKETIKSARWRSLKLLLIEEDPRCAVCGFDYQKNHDKWKLQLDHKTYRLPNGDLIFGKEQRKDVRLLCRAHHLKGTRTDEAIQAWRNSVTWMKVAAWIGKQLGRLVRWLLLLPFRCLRATWRHFHDR